MATPACPPPVTPGMNVAHLKSLGKPPAAPRRLPPPPLMVALDLYDHAQCAARVAEVLKADAEAAFFPFFDHDCEPPLCYAIRQGCGVEAIKLLLDYGADVNAMDACGKTPIQLLWELPWDNAKPQIQNILFAAGADDNAATAVDEFCLHERADISRPLPTLLGKLPGTPTNVLAFDLDAQKISPFLAWLQGTAHPNKLVRPQ